MSNEQDDTPEAQGDQNGQNPTGKDANPNPEQPQKQEGYVPHGAFHEEREKRKAAEERVKELEEAQAERERKAAEESGKFEDLYKSTKSELEEANQKIEGLQATVTEFESSVEETVKSALDGVKDQKDRDLIESLLDGKTAAQKQSILPGLVEKFTAPKNINPSVDGGGSPANKRTAEDVQKDIKEAQEKKDARAVLKLERELNSLKRG